MTTTAQVYRGAAWPEGYQLTLTKGDSGQDMTDVTGVTLYVSDKDGNETTWDTSLTSTTSTVLVVTHIFATDASDVPTPKRLTILPKLTDSSGNVRRAEPRYLLVT